MQTSDLRDIQKGKTVSMEKSEKKIFTKPNVISFVKTVSFVLVFIIILQSLSAGVFSKSRATTYKNRFNKAYSFLLEPENSLDIVGIGSSNLYSAFVPTTLWSNYGYTSCVISKPHQTTVESYGFLKEVLQTQKPKVLIIETDMLYENAGAFNPNGKKHGKLYQTAAKTRKKLDDFYNNLNADEFQDTVMSKFSIFRFHNRWKTLKPKDLQENKKNTGYMAIDHGYNFNNSVKAAKANSNMKESDISNPVGNEDLMYLKKMIQLCRENGITPLLVEMPSNDSWDYYKHNAVAEIAEENSVQFVDFNLLFDEIDFDIKADYRDGGSHCNYFGAEKTTNYLGELFKTDYSSELSDKRSDAAFAYWYESVKAFDKKYKV